jgi:hypothetical protein
VFQQITEVVDLRHLIGSTPQATIFQASFCLVLYNLIQVIRAWIAAARPELTAVDSLSSEQLFGYVREEWTALNKVVTPAHVAASIPRTMTLAEIQDRLRRLLGGVWSPLWIKAVNKKPRPAPKKIQGSCAHTSSTKSFKLIAKNRSQHRDGHSQSCSQQWDRAPAESTRQRLDWSPVVPGKYARELGGDGSQNSKTSARGRRDNLYRGSKIFEKPPPKKAPPFLASKDIIGSGRGWILGRVEIFFERENLGCWLALSRWLVHRNGRGNRREWASVSTGAEIREKRQFFRAIPEIGIHRVASRH